MWQEFHLHLQDLGTLPGASYKTLKLGFFSLNISQKERKTGTPSDRRPSLQMEGFIRVLVQLWLQVWVEGHNHVLHFMLL